MLTTDHAHAATTPQTVDFKKGCEVKADTTQTDLMMSLRPKNSTSAAIKDAIERATKERAVVDTRIEVLRAEAGKMLLHGSARDMETNNDAIAQGRLLVEKLNALLDALRTALKDATKRERVEHLRRQYAEIGYDEACAKAVDFLQNKYADLAREIAAGLTLEDAALSLVPRALRIVEALKKEGVETPAFDYPAVIAFGPLSRITGLCEAVQLPGALGAPFVCMKHFLEKAVTTKEVPDEDGPWGMVAGSNNRQPLRKKTVSRTDDVLRLVPTRDDTVIWPPPGKSYSNKPW